MSMRRSSLHPDPYLVGVEQPALIIPAHLAVILWPGIVRFVREHEQQGATGKLKALESLLYRWNHLVELHRMDGPAFACEPTDGGSPADTGRCSHMATTTSSPTWLTTGQAATRLGCTPTHVARLVGQGDLDGRKVGRDWQIDEASVVALEAARRTA